MEYLNNMKNKYSFLLFKEPNEWTYEESKTHKNLWIIIMCFLTIGIVFSQLSVSKNNPDRRFIAQEDQPEHYHKLIIKKVITNGPNSITVFYLEDIVLKRKDFPACQQLKYILDAKDEMYITWTTKGDKSYTNNSSRFTWDVVVHLRSTENIEP